jgi:hypothetical protein
VVAFVIPATSAQMEPVPTHKVFVLAVLASSIVETMCAENVAQELNAPMGRVQDHQANAVLLVKHCVVTEDVEIAVKLALMDRARPVQTNVQVLEAVAMANLLVVTTTNA